nr:apolipoprotein N-acyltransferase [Ipomoea batatas]GMC83129.1 apolipoprotein N-acyltransferase [Ipomoea batatas]
MNGVAITPALLLRRFKGKPEALYSDTNFLIEAMELRSNSMTLTLALGISLTILLATALPLSRLRTAKITCTPRKARTRAVSAPMPHEGPVTMAMRSVPSIPSVTSSAVEEAENPDSPFIPKIHISCF